MIVYIRAASIYDDSRATKEISSLLKLNKPILVIGWDKDGKAREKCNIVFGQDNITFSFYPKRVDGGLGIKGLGKLLGFIKYVYKTLEHHQNDVEVVHACDLDGGLGAYRFCKKYQIRMVYDIYDYYVDTHYVPKLLNKVVEDYEIRIINYANVTIICTEERIEQIKKASPKKLIVIHNSPNVKDEMKNSLEGKYDYAYCGTLSEMRLLEEIFDNYGSHSSMSFAVAGSGRLENKVKVLSQKYNNFEYFGAIPYQEVLNIENKARVLSAIYEPSIRNHRLCAPNKFYEALALAKPIIVCEGTGIDRIVKDNDIGCVIKYGADSFYNALQYLINHPEEALEMGKRARSLYDDRYSWDIMESRLLMTYKEMLKC